MQVRIADQAHLLEIMKQMSVSARRSMWPDVAQILEVPP